MFLHLRAFSLKPLLLKSSKMNSHTEIELFARALHSRGRGGEKVGREGKKSWRANVGAKPLSCPDLTLPSAKTAWNYLKFYTTIGLLLTPCQSRQGRLPVGRLFRVWSTPTARMPSAVELLIFTGVARSTKRRVRACQQQQRARCTGFFFFGKYQREGFTIW